MDYDTICDEIAYAIIYEALWDIIDPNDSKDTFMSKCTRQNMIDTMRIYNKEMCNNVSLFELDDNDNIINNEFIIHSSNVSYYFYFENGNVLKSDTMPYYIRVNNNTCILFFNSINRIMLNQPNFISYSRNKIFSIRFNAYYDCETHFINGIIKDNDNIFTKLSHGIEFLHSFYDFFTEILVDSEEKWDKYLDNYSYDKFIDADGNFLFNQVNVKWKFDD